MQAPAPREEENTVLNLFVPPAKMRKWTNGWKDTIPRDTEPGMLFGIAYFRVSHRVVRDNVGHLLPPTSSDVLRSKAIMDNKGRL
jgi:hypothetical protein